MSSMVGGGCVDSGGRRIVGDAERPSVANDQRILLPLYFTLTALFVYQLFACMSLHSYIPSGIYLHCYLRKRG